MTQSKNYVLAILVLSFALINSCTSDVRLDFLVKIKGDNYQLIIVSDTNDRLLTLEQDKKG